MNISQIIDSAISDNSLIQVTLSRPIGGKLANVSRATARLVQISGEPKWQISIRAGAQELHENYETTALSDRVNQLLNDFRRCHVFTSTADYSAKRHDTDFEVRQSPATKKPSVAEHDRQKQYLIPEGSPCPFLAEIGVMTNDGRVRKAKYSKFRQINRFLELVGDVAEHLPTVGKIRVVDFGCGKSYLTFALHHFLTELLGRDVEMIGMDLKTDVVQDCQKIADKLLCRGLTFRVGDIQTLQLEELPIHLCVSLHACDTATDIAIAKAIDWGTKVIMAVPCCQHELTSQLKSDTLEPLLRHGILRERFAALVTDALRAEVLQQRGYQTQILEFIDMEHTPKNLLIRAIRTAQPSVDSCDRVAQLREAFRIERFALADQNESGIDSRTND